jgi:hypothetical protein
MASALGYSRTQLPSGATASGVLTVGTTQVGTDAAVTEKDLWTYSLPANTLSANGKTVRVSAFGTVANNANNKTIKLYFNGTSITTTTTVAATAGWRIEADIVRTASGAQISCATVWTFNTAGNVPARNIQVTSHTATDTAAIAIKVTGQNGTANANDIVFRVASVEVLN